MKKWKKLLCVLLAATTAFSMCACGGKKDDTATNDNSGDSGAKTALDLSDMSYDEQSSAIYEYVLGDFYEAYQAALASENNDERYALMAIAEAKMLESGIMTPTYGNGGNYRITRVAPYSISPVLWGVDMYKYDTILVTEDLIKGEDVTEIRAKWNELKGTGTFREWETNFLKDTPDLIVQAAAEDNPMGRNATPADVVPAMTFLLSDEAGFITGVTLPVTGGSAIV